MRYEFDLSDSQKLCNILSEYKPEKIVLEFENTEANTIDQELRKQLQDILLATYSNIGADLNFTINAKTHSLHLQEKNEEKYYEYFEKCARNGSILASLETTNSIQSLLQENNLAQAKQLALESGQYFSLLQYFQLHKTPQEVIALCDEILQSGHFSVQEDKGLIHELKGMTYVSINNANDALRSFLTGHLLGNIASGLQYYEILHAKIEEDPRAKTVSDRVLLEIERNPELPSAKKAIRMQIYNYLAEYYANNPAANSADKAMNFWSAIWSEFDANNPFEYYKAKKNLIIFTYEKSEKTAKDLNELKISTDYLIKRINEGLRPIATENEIVELRSEIAYFLSSCYQDSPNPLALIDALKYAKIAIKDAECESSGLAAQYLIRYYENKPEISNQDRQFLLEFYLQGAKIYDEAQDIWSAEMRAKARELLLAGVLPRGFDNINEDAKNQMDNFHLLTTELNILEGNFIYAQYLENHFPKLNSQLYYNLAKQEAQKALQRLNEDKPEARKELVKGPYEKLFEDIEKIKKDPNSSPQIIADLLANTIINTAQTKSSDKKKQAKEMLAAYLEKGFTLPKETLLKLQEKNFVPAIFKLFEEETDEKEALKWLKQAQNQGYEKAKLLLLAQDQFTTDQAQLEELEKNAEEEKLKHAKIDVYARNFSADLFSSMQKDLEQQRYKQHALDSALKNLQQKYEDFYAKKEEPYNRIAKLKAQTAALGEQLRKSQDQNNQQQLNLYCEDFIVNKTPLSKEDRHLISSLLDRGYKPQIENINQEQVLQTLAENGIAAAHYPLFLLYQETSANGDQTKIKLALEHINKAKETGHPLAIFDYALIYESYIHRHASKALAKFHESHYNDFDYYFAPHSNSDIDITKMTIDLKEISELYTKSRDMGCTQAALALAEFHSGKWKHCYIEKNDEIIKENLRNFFEKKTRPLSENEEKIVKKLIKKANAQTEFAQHLPDAAISSASSSALAPNSHMVRI